MRQTAAQRKRMEAEMNDISRVVVPPDIEAQCDARKAKAERALAAHDAARKEP